MAEPDSPDSLVLSQAASWCSMIRRSKTGFPVPWAVRAPSSPEPSPSACCLKSRLQRPDRCGVAQWGRAFHEAQSFSIQQDLPLDEDITVDFVLRREVSPARMIIDLSASDEWGKRFFDPDHNHAPDHARRSQRMNRLFSRGDLYARPPFWPGRPVHGA